MQHLGDFVLAVNTFQNIEKKLESFRTENFQKLNEKEKRHFINHALYELIAEVPAPCFLLSSVLDFIARVEAIALIEHYHFSHFELWLNQFSGLSREENYLVRAKIVGKWVPREEYQILFPISMGKTYPGSHYVTAHGSPDIDTTIASFWGWADAFGARVSEGLHLWNVPGGTPSAQVEVEQLFYQPFGREIFAHLAKSHTSLMLSSIDLVSQKGVVEKQEKTSLLSVEHERHQNAVILVDDQGSYLGDWRNFDIEGVRQVIELFHLCLRWFENYFYTELIRLFSQERVERQEFALFVDKVLSLQLKNSYPTPQLTTLQKKRLSDYLVRVLGVKEGLDSSFEAFAAAMEQHGLSHFSALNSYLRSLIDSDLFDAQGVFHENRPLLFKKLEKILLGIDEALDSIDRFVDRLIVSLNIKKEVFGYLPQAVSYRAELAEMREKMGNYPYLTVTYPDRQGRQIPLGVIHAQELYRPILGTVSVRDFCNREETKIPPYFEVISVVDHHKMQMSSLTPPVAHISDAQSSNAMVAELAFAINDRYSTGGMRVEEIQAQIAEIGKDLSSLSSKRIMRRLLQRLMHAENSSAFYIDPQREFLEYLQFVYAILDDTDLLTKVSMRDLICMASLLNRLKSLLLKKEVEIIHFDDIEKDENFTRLAVKRFLQNLDMYSLCRRIYLAKEENVEQNLKLCAANQPSTFFSDTKEQNGCCRVGQSKLYARNFLGFTQVASELRHLFWEGAQSVYREKSDIDFHLHMISTISGAEDLFAGSAHGYSHKDEIWIWIPETEQAVAHLKSFLHAFRALPGLHAMEFTAQFLGGNRELLKGIFEESFISIPIEPPSSHPELPIAMLRFKAGSINSRKAMISPYLPRL